MTKEMKSVGERINLMNTCGWYGNEKTGECDILCNLQCIERGKCTFYETSEEKEERLTSYNKILEATQERLHNIGKKKKWNKTRLKEEWNALIKLSAIEKEKYFALYE